MLSPTRPSSSPLQGENHVQHSHPTAALTLLFVGLLITACPEDPAAKPKVEVDHLKTSSAFVGSSPIITGVVSHCTGTPPAKVLANGVEVASAPAALFESDEDVYPDGVALFTMRIDEAELSPTVFGVPADIEVVLQIRCDGEWVSSPPYPISYLKTAASIVPPFNPVRFWPAQTPGDLLACRDTKLVYFEQATNPTVELELGFPCAVTQMSEGVDGRRYIDGKSLGIAAVNSDSTLAWTRPGLIVDVWTDPIRDPVVLREEGDDVFLVVLDQASGADSYGPLPLTHNPLGPLARDSLNNILVLESETVMSPAESRTYYVERFAANGTPLDLLAVVTYNWLASYLAEFDLAGEHVYVAAAPDSEDVRWLEKIELLGGTAVWSTSPEDGWLHPLGEASGRVLVASEDQLVWLDPQTGLTASEPFAPDSGKIFLRGAVEEDGSVVLLADPSSNVARGLYLFAPDGHPVVRFHPESAVFRWIAPGWGSGTLVSYYDEIHWLHSRAEYEELVGD